MKKYLAVGKAAFKTRGAYRFDTAMQVMAGAFRVLFAWLLWTAIYSGRREMAGFTMEAMMLYYIIQSFFAQLDNTGQIADEMAGNIRNGTFSKFLVLPIRVQGYLFAQSLGGAAYMAFFSLGAGILCLAAFSIPSAGIFSFQAVLSAAALLLLGRVFLTQFHFFLGILTFKFQDIWIFLMIKNNLLAFLSGTLIPLTLMPETVLYAMRLTPFYYAAHLPAMLLLGREGEGAAEGLLVLLAWIILFYFLNKGTYARLRTRYDGVGI